MRGRHDRDPWYGEPPDGWSGPSIGEPDWFDNPPARRAVRDPSGRRTIAQTEILETGQAELHVGGRELEATGPSRPGG